MFVEQKIWGIDFGSKLAGTTVVAYEAGGKVCFRASVKKQDADQMIVSLAAELSPELIGIDAPLSLPGVFTGRPGFEDYFYRQCDKFTKAMSPMFLGGLTARAIKLAAGLETAGTKLIEVYPVKAGVDMELKQYGYRSKGPDVEKIIDQLIATSGLEPELTPDRLTGHHIDAWLALIITKNQAAGKARQAGDAAEGLIYF